MTKRIQNIITAALLCILCLTATPVKAQTFTMEQCDSLEFSVLTCEPYDQVWSLYGHTALRVHDLHEGSKYDIVMNYGIFDLSKSMFVLRFVFGLTDYRMDWEPFDYFCKHYQDQGRGIVEQVLDLKTSEKYSLLAALEENLKPENAVYRYNYFYDNCTTRVRDMIESHLEGSVSIRPGTPFKNKYQSKTGWSFRKLIHEWNEDHRWARFGNDLLLGVNADKKTKAGDSQFLPFNYKDDLDRTYVKSVSPLSRKLVKETRYPLQMQYEKNKGLSTFDSWTQPESVFTILFFITLILTYIEYRMKRRFWVYDAALLLVSGLGGIVLTAMIFSQHPTVSLNLQILMLNPFNLFFLYPVIKKERKGDFHWYWYVLGIMFTATALINKIHWQTYAEGFIFIALALGVRAGAALYYKEKKEKNEEKA